MKKLIPLLLIVSVSSLSYAESMKFITVLSSPVGTFNKLEAVDPAQPAKGNTVNFCTNIGTQGVVELKGTKPAALSTVSLSKNTTLGKTDEGKFSLSKIELHSGGNIKGGRLFGNTFTVNNAVSGKANNLYGNQLTVAGAKTKTLDVNGGDSNITTQHAAADMVWSNEYQSDTACGNTATCAKQYLLKERSGSPCANEKARTYWNGSACVCPSAGRPTPVGYLPEYDTCCYLDGEKKEPCWKIEKRTTTSCSGYKWTNSSSKEVWASCGKVSGYGEARCWVGTGYSSLNPTAGCNDLPGLVMLADKSVSGYCNWLTVSEGAECTTGPSSGRPCISGVANKNGGDMCLGVAQSWSGYIGYSVMSCTQECKTEETEGWQPQWLNK